MVWTILLFALGFICALFSKTLCWIFISWRREVGRDERRRAREARRARAMLETIDEIRSRPGPAVPFEAILEELHRRHGPDSV